MHDYWQGEQHSIYQNGRVRVRINGKFGILNKNGEKITDIKYDDIGSFYKNRAIVILDDKKGLIDENGHEVIPPKYARLTWLDQFAFKFEKEWHQREYGIIAVNGKIILSEIEGGISTKDGFGPGLYRVWSSSEKYFIDRHGTKHFMFV